MDMIYETNYVKLCGTLAGAPAYSHTGRGRQFYSFPLEVRRLSGTADDAMLDLLCALMEAKASGRDDLAMRSLAQAQQYLHMLGVEILFYDQAHAQHFDILPTMGDARTIRPAMMKDGRAESIDGTIESNNGFPLAGL